MKCRICSGETEKFLRAPIFKEHREIDYYKCPQCGFIQTEEPDWLDKAYSDVIAKSDIGLIYRNRELSDALEKVLLNFYPGAGKGLDYGGGYGMFVRIMRDKGFDFYWHDDYCKNMFAEGFEGSLDSKYDLITAFEVFEHLPDPAATISSLLGKCNILFFSTDLHDGVEDFRNWWYRAELSGQHISFFSKKSLEFLAKKHGVHYYSFNNSALKALSKVPFNQQQLNKLFNQRNDILSRVARAIKGEKTVKRESLLGPDHEAILKKYLNS